MTSINLMDKFTVNVNSQYVFITFKFKWGLEMPLLETGCQGIFRFREKGNGVRMEVKVEI